MRCAKKPIWVEVVRGVEERGIYPAYVCRNLGSPTGASVVVKFPPGYKMILTFGRRHDMRAEAVPAGRRR